MFITINGDLGSGKTTVCNLLKNFGFEIFSAGSIQRQMANSMNISTLELNKNSKEDFSYDFYIDNSIVEYAKKNTGKRIVFDSRLAWHFVPDSMKVRLTIKPYIAAERVFLNRQTSEESYSSVEETMEKLLERQKTEIERYQMIYNVAIDDTRNYDLIIDTTSLKPTDIVNIIICNYQQRFDLTTI